MQLHQLAVSGFVYKLSPSQRASLLKLLVTMAAVDHEITVEEEAFLVEWATKWGLPLDLTPEAKVNDDALLAEFEDFSSKMIVLQEIVKLSYQDGHFGDEERHKVKILAERMGIYTPNVLNKVNRWVRSWYDWHFEGERMLETHNWISSD